jgi:hypothetical protein
MTRDQVVVTRGIDAHGNGGHWRRKLASCCWQAGTKARLAIRPVESCFGYALGS